MSDLLSTIHFASPLWLWFTPLSLALLYLVLWRTPGQFKNITYFLQSFAHQTYRHPAIEVLRQFTHTQTASQQRHQSLQKFLGLGLCILLLHLSLAQPYRLGQKLPDPPQHRDIFFIIDTSVSMVLRDYLMNDERISRLTMLKSVMHHFIQQLQGNRIGLVIYSEQAYTLVPLTTDYALLQQQIRRVQPAVLTGRTSNPGKALLYTVQQIKQGSYSNDKPILVLITDTNRPSREIDPRVSASYVAQQGLKLHTIAIGAGSYAAEETGSNSLIYHPANFELLQQVATAGQGQFFSANSSQSLGQALQVIQQAEQRQIKTVPQYIKLNLYQWPLLTMLCWFTMLQLLSLMRWRV